jgi:hypothetical protein
MGCISKKDRHDRHAPRLARSGALEAWRSCAKNDRHLISMIARIESGVAMMIHDDPWFFKNDRHKNSASGRGIRGVWRSWRSFCKIPPPPRQIASAAAAASL